MSAEHNVKHDAEFYTGLDAERARTYDTNIRIDIPGYELMHEMAHAFVAAAVPQGGKVLIPGCGTGHEVVEYARKHPDWTVVAVDPAEPMLSQAKEKVRAQGIDNVIFHHGYVDDLPPDEKFDASVCVLTMHFIPDDGRKQSFLNEVARRLQPGGLYVNVDMICDDPQQLRNTMGAAVKHWMFDQASIHYPKEVKEDAAQVLAYIDNGIEEQIREVHHISESRLREMMEQAKLHPPNNFYTAFYYRGWLTTKC